jgi:hypothetical protein
VREDGGHAGDRAGCVAEAQLAAQRTRRGPVGNDQHDRAWFLGYWCDLHRHAAMVDAWTVEINVTLGHQDVVAARFGDH